MRTDYGTLAARFWEMHKTEAFKQTDAMLYLFLVNEWNQRKRPEWFGIETRYLEITLPISRKSLIFSRERLRARGLIDYEVSGGRTTPRYAICVSTGNTKGNTKGNTNETQNDICVSNSVSQGNTKQFVLPQETQKSVLRKRNAPPTPPYKEKEILIDCCCSYGDNNDNNNGEKNEIKIPGGMTLYGIDEIVARLKESNEWKESMRRTFNLTEAELLEILDSYPDYCTNLGETRKTINEAKRHITYRMQKLQQSHQLFRSTNEAKREDRFSERRGTDPAANRAEDYTSTF